MIRVKIRLAMVLAKRLVQKGKATGNLAGKLITILMWVCLRITAMLAKVLGMMQNQAMMSVVKIRKLMLLRLRMRIN